MDSQKLEGRMVSSEQVIVIDNQIKSTSHLLCSIRIMGLFVQPIFSTTDRRALTSSRSPAIRKPAQHCEVTIQTSDSIPTSTPQDSRTYHNPPRYSRCPIPRDTTSDMARLFHLLWTLAMFIAGTAMAQSTYSTYNAWTNPGCLAHPISFHFS
jgi:hypothetical protein